MNKLFRLLSVLGLLLMASGLTEITAKDTKKTLEDRIVMLENKLQLVISTLNGPVSDSIQLMDERTLDLNERLHKYELSQENDKARARR